MGNGRKAQNMVMENFIIQMEVFIVENGRKIRNMDMENIHMITEMFMKVIFIRFKKGENFTKGMKIYFCDLKLILEI